MIHCPVLTREQEILGLGCRVGELEGLGIYWHSGFVVFTVSQGLGFGIYGYIRV